MQYITQNSEIIDNQTGLIWQRDVQNNLTYEQALELAERVALETGLAWRVPTVEELSSLLDRTRSFPASAFPDMPSDWFWSSTPDVGTADYAWSVDFKSGYVINDCLERQYAVRLVRTCGDQNAA